MAADDNVERARRRDQAPGRGDLASIVDAVEGDVDWAVVGPDGVPLVGSDRGKKGVERFFGIVAESTEREGTGDVEIHEVVPVGDGVDAFGLDRIRVKEPGPSDRSWWVNASSSRDGEVSRFREIFHRGAAPESFRMVGPGASSDEVWAAPRGGESPAPTEGGSA